MQEDTGATITIDETEGVGKVQVSAPNKDSIDAAIAKIKAIVAIPEVGEIYEGTVRSIMPYGCFVEIMPGKDGLLHISEIDWKRLETVEEAGIKEGDKIKVKLLEIDPKTGKYKLSHRVLIEKPADYVERPARGERRERPERVIVETVVIVAIVVSIAHILSIRKRRRRILAIRSITWTFK